MGLQESPMTLKGGVTPRVQVYKSESHKLHQAFNPKVTSGTAATIIKGAPVKLETDGTISPFTGSGMYLGIAVTDSINPAYGEQRSYPTEVTVMVEGFVIVNWVANADISNAGYVTPISTAPTAADHTVKCEASQSDTNFIALHPADEGEVVQVLVK